MDRLARLVVLGGLVWLATGCAMPALVHRTGVRFEVPVAFTGARADDRLLVLEFETREHRAAFTRAGEPDGWSEPTGAPPRRGWIALPIDALLEGARPDADRDVQRGSMPRALVASTVEVPLRRDGPAPSDGAALPPLLLMVERLGDRDRGVVVLVETPAGRQRGRIAADDLVRRARKLWAYPVVVLAFPFAAAFDVTVGGAIVPGLLAFEARAEQDRSEAAAAADQDGSGLCGRCQQQREDREILK